MAVKDSIPTTSSDIVGDGDCVFHALTLIFRDRVAMLGIAPGGIVREQSTLLLLDTQHSQTLPTVGNAVFKRGELATNSHGM